VDTCAAEFEVYTPSHHPTYDRGDGMCGRLVSSPIGILGQTVHNTKVRLLPNEFVFCAQYEFRSYRLAVNRALVVRS
jgi:hypothetical protein